MSAEMIRAMEVRSRLLKEEAARIRASFSDDGTTRAEQAARAWYCDQQSREYGMLTRMAQGLPEVQEHLEPPAWVCQNCTAVNSASLSACGHCGMKR